MVLGKHQDARENKTNCFPRDLTLNSINTKIAEASENMGCRLGRCIFYTHFSQSS